MEKQFKKGMVQDVDTVIDLIQARIEWMDEMGIEQWNKDDYLAYFTRDYFIEQAEEGNLHILLQGCQIIGAVVVTEEDMYWENDCAAYYIHNLVTDRAHVGIGGVILQQIELLARNEGIKILRLDVELANEKLNAYYDQKGYELVGEIMEENYFSKKREKRL